MASSTDTLPIPYETGKRLGIQILENFHDPAIPNGASVIIGKVHSITMSPVMDVTIVTPTGHLDRAVLKVYDRRFGTGLRQVGRDYVPCTLADEAAFQAFIKTGNIGPFLEEHAKAQEEGTRPIRATHFLDQDHPDRIERYETALWLEAKEHFECETKAYRRLAEFQGKLIPRIYGHVRLMLPRGETGPIPAPFPEDVAPYLDVKGILLEHISGYDLCDLPTSPLAPPETTTWQAVVQAAIDAAEVINRNGVMMADCDPRNVVVDQHSQTPFIIDLAQCSFKEEVIAMLEEYDPEDKEWYRDESDEDWEWNAEAEWWQQLQTTGSFYAIGAVTATMVKRAKGIEMKLKYPDFQKVAAAIRQRARKGVTDA